MITETNDYVNSVSMKLDCKFGSFGLCQPLNTFHIYKYMWCYGSTIAPSIVITTYCPYLQCLGTKNKDENMNA